MIQASCKHIHDDTLLDIKGGLEMTYRAIETDYIYMVECLRAI